MMFPLRTMVENHLHHNHYPPVRGFTDAAMAAIEAGNDRDYERNIDTPNGPMRAGDIVEGLHLSDFLESDNDEYENYW